MWSSAWNSRLGWPSRRATVEDAGDEPGPVGAGVAVAADDPLHEAVPGVAVGGDDRGADGAVLVGLVVRLLEDRRAGPLGLGDAPVDVGHLEGDVDDAVAVRAVVVGVRCSGVDRSGDDEPDRPGLEDVGLVVAVAGLRPAVGDEVHAPGGLVVVRGLGGVADHEDDRVPPGDGEDVLRLVIGDQPDELLQLVHVEACVAFLLGEVVGDRRRLGTPSSSSCPEHAGTRDGGQPVADTVVTVRTLLPVCRFPLDTVSMPTAGPGRARRRASCASTPHEPNVGVLGASRRLGVARGTVQARLDRLTERGVIRVVRPDHRPGRPRLPGDRVLHAGDPAGAGTRSGRRAPGADPGGAGGAHDHRLRRPAHPHRRPRQRRPPAGHRPRRRRLARDPRLDRHRRWPTRIEYRTAPLVTAAISS